MFLVHFAMQLVQNDIVKPSGHFRDDCSQFNNGLTMLIPVVAVEELPLIDKGGMPGIDGDGIAGIVTLTEPGTMGIVMLVEPVAGEDDPGVRALGYGSNI